MDAVFQSVTRVFRVARGAVGNAILPGFSVCVTYCTGRKHCCGAAAFVRPVVTVGYLGTV